jgi:hypothetical protein
MSTHIPRRSRGQDGKLRRRRSAIGFYRDSSKKIRPISAPRPRYRFKVGMRVKTARFEKSSRDKNITKLEQSKQAFEDREEARIENELERNYERTHMKQEDRDEQLSRLERGQLSSSKLDNRTSCKKSQSEFRQRNPSGSCPI